MIDSRKMNLRLYKRQYCSRKRPFHIKPVYIERPFARFYFRQKINHTMDGNRKIQKKGIRFLLYIEEYRGIIMTAQQITGMMMDRIAAFEVIASKIQTKSEEDARTMAISTYALFDDIEKFIEENKEFDAEYCANCFIENGNFVDRSSNVVIVKNKEDYYLKKTKMCVEKTRSLYGLLISIANTLKNKNAISESSLKDRMKYNAALDILAERLMQEMNKARLGYISDTMFKLMLKKS